MMVNRTMVPPGYKRPFVDPNTTTDTSSDSSSGLSAGAIAGIVVGAVAVVAIAAVAALFLVRKKATSKPDDESAAYSLEHESMTNKDTLNKLTSSDDPAWEPIRISNLSEGDFPASNTASVKSTSEASSILPPVAFDTFLLPSSALQFKETPNGQKMLLGQGRYGNVYSAVLNNVEDVAVKCVYNKVLTMGEDASYDMISSTGGTEDGDSRSPLSSSVKDRILSEAALLKACNSRYIVRFAGLCFKPYEVQIVTELMAGGNLWTALRNGRVKGWIPAGRKIALDVAAGLCYLHTHRVVHLDLKSSNILLDDNGGAKISDVGQSKIIPASRDYLTSNIGFGTWQWCSPEVIMGLKASPASDIWSFGVVLWELITGEPPIRGQMRDVKVPEECSQEVADILTRCWATDPMKRPTATQLVAQLRGIMDKQSKI